MSEVESFAKVYINVLGILTPRWDTEGQAFIPIRHSPTKLLDYVPRQAGQAGI